MQKQKEQKTMNKTLHAASLVLALAAPALASAQASGTAEFTPYDRSRGELSPDTQAPRIESLVSALDSSRVAPSQLASLLEYGERVECHECVAPLQERMLDPRTDATVREMAAWWLRRRPFAFGAVMAHTRGVLTDDADPLRRAAAASAIGEFMDPHGVAHLTTAASGDGDARVRTAAVRGLARINSPTGIPALVAALADRDATVVDAALQSVLRVNFWRDAEPVMQLLAHDDANIRRRAALVLASLRTAEAIPALSAMLMGDENAIARQSAAFALGRIGGVEARAALDEADARETNDRVRDAIYVARSMR
jgi:HEAT repeats